MKSLWANLLHFSLSPFSYTIGLCWQSCCLLSCCCLLFNTDRVWDKLCTCFRMLAPLHLHPHIMCKAHAFSFSTTNWLTYRHIPFPAACAHTFSPFLFSSHTHMHSHIHICRFHTCSATLAHTLTVLPDLQTYPKSMDFQSVLTAMDRLQKNTAVLPTVDFCGPLPFAHKTQLLYTCLQL